MAMYSLNGLGHERFEHLCQSLLKEIIGSGTITFGAGTDGAREATFSGKAPYPSESDQWSGDWIFQAKFHDMELIGTTRARKTLLSDLRAELTKIVNRYKHPCDNYILITNVPLSSVYPNGDHDYVTNTIAPEFSSDIQHIHVWGADDVCCFLDRYDSIRKAYDLMTLSDWNDLRSSSETWKASLLNRGGDKYFANLPDPPDDEIPRDTLVRTIAGRFNQNCTRQLIVAPVQSGKTNLVSQFYRRYEDNSIAYFITPSPLSQSQHSFLYSMCAQICKITGKEIPTPDIDLESLKSLANALFQRLHGLAKEKKANHFCIIDGFEWAFDGREGTRIVDLFPLPTSQRIFILLSCRSDEVTRLPSCCTSESIIDETYWNFNSKDTQEYFKDLSDRLNEKDIDKIHELYKGMPGHLCLVKNAIIADDQFDISSVPEDISILISDHVNRVFQCSSHEVKYALELMAVSPVPLLEKILVHATGEPGLSLINSLKTTHLVRYNSEQDRYEYLNEITRNTVRDRISDRLQEITQTLLDIVERLTPGEEQLIDVLQIQLGDYEGLKRRLEVDCIIRSTTNPIVGISSVIKRLHTAAKMSEKRNDMEELIRWTFVTGIVRSFISEASDSSEAYALIAIGDSVKAIEKAISFPEVTTKIRLLAKSYTSMKARGEIISLETLESLKAMAENLVVEEFDRDIAQEIAVDLFPILPDSSIALLERVIGKHEGSGIVDAAIETISESSRKKAKDNLLSAVAERVGARGIRSATAEWVKGLPFVQIVEELERIERTGAKEYILRLWCLNNSSDIRLTDAILMWQRLIVEDRNFVVPLRSLRQISQLILRVANGDKNRLLQAIRVPGLMSIDSPREEWLSFHLNLAEALFDIDPDKALSEIVELHHKVINLIFELDTRAFCMARLLLTCKRVLPHYHEFVDKIERDFQQAFDTLIDMSAEQFELSRDVIRILVEIDPEKAMIAALELNTQSRRRKALEFSLRVALCEYSQNDLSKVVDASLSYLEYDPLGRDISLVKAISELEGRQCILCEANLESLLSHAKKIGGHTLRSEALGYLASLYQTSNIPCPPHIVEMAIDGWRSEPDLRIKSLWGYELVECLAKVDLDNAKLLFSDVQTLNNRAESFISGRGLNDSYMALLDLAIRATDDEYLNSNEENARELEEYIERLQSEVDKVHMFASFASNAYRCNRADYGDELVRRKILPRIKSSTVRIEKFVALDHSFPMIFKYDPLQAKELIHDLPQHLKDHLLLNYLIWELSQCYLDDTKEIEPENIDVPRYFKEYRKIIEEAVKEIKGDALIYCCVSAIVSSLKKAFTSDIVEQMQVIDILRMLDELCLESLPDHDNIRHDGYLIKSQSTIHGLRSFVFRYLEKAKGKSTRGLDKKDIRSKWDRLIMAAEKITNIADRALVLASISEDSRNYYDTNRAYSKEILKKAENDAKNIPTVFDRLDRFQSIAKAWETLNDRKRAEYVLNLIKESAAYLRRASIDQGLNTLVQTAYKIDKELAEKIVSEFDQSRVSGGLKSPANVSIQVERLVDKPSQLTINGSKNVKDNVLRSAAIPGI